MIRPISIFASCAALVTFAVGPAMAEEASFRAPEAQAFSAEEQARYGVAFQTVDDVQRAVQTGETIVLTPEEAAAIQAGLTDTQWLLIGIAVGVVVIIAVA